MNKILVIGAGLSTGCLVTYLLDQCVENNWSLTLADKDLNAAKDKIKGHAKGKALSLDILNSEERRSLIQNHDVVISYFGINPIPLQYSFTCLSSSSLNKGNSSTIFFVKSER